MYPNEQGFFTHAVPKKFANASLETCDRQSPEVIDFCRQWAKNPTSIFIYAKVGRGKTRLAFAMIREMFRSCKRRIWPYYLTSPDLSSRLLKAAKSDSGDTWEIENWATQDLLFIDDFGRETASDRVQRQYFEIINKRYAEDLPTLITSNFSFDELGKTLGDAVPSRFQEYTYLELSGPDLRVNS